MNKDLSEAISFLRFPLACLVVFKHYFVPEISSEALNAGTLYDFIFVFISKVVTALPVPLFFIVSGILFYKNVDVTNGFHKEDYFSKLKKRIKSLLVPYLSWNALVLLLFAFVQSMSNNNTIVSKDGYKLISEYSAVDFFKAFYALDSTKMPIDGPLWFIRDLFVVICFSPLLFFLIRSIRWNSILLFLICFASFEHFMAPFYFTIGACMSLLKVDVTDYIGKRQYRICLFTIIVLATILTTSIYSGNSIFFRISSMLFCCIGSLSLLILVVNLCHNQCVPKIPEWFGTASFFIFAIHKPILVIIRKLIFCFHTNSDIILISFSFVIPTLVIGLSLVVFYIIKRFFPSLSFLNGYRI